MFRMESIVDQTKKCLLGRCTKSSLFVAILPLSVISTAGFSFEDTKVLPIGIRNLTIKQLHTDLVNKTTSSGDYENLASKLNKDLLFKDAINKESGFKKKEIEAFMLANGYTPQDALGRFSANMTAIVDVTAPLFSYGITDKVTMAIAVPFYSAKTRTEIGFKSNSSAFSLVEKLDSPYINQTAKGRETGAKLNQAEEQLNVKLTDNGYQELGEWSGQGVGDITLAAKYRFLNGDVFRAATTNGFVLPTGRTDDPDILTDLPFGDGTFDYFTQIAFDQKIDADVTVNQYMKYTYQFEAQGEFRMKTEANPLEVEKQVITYQPGQKTEAGMSMQFAPQSGYLFGFGIIGSKKDGDRYNVADEAVRSELQRDTNATATYTEIRFGYTSIPAFQRKEAAVPYALSFDLKKHLASLNTPTGDLLTMNLGVFF